MERSADGNTQTSIVGWRLHHFQVVEFLARVGGGSFSRSQRKEGRLGRKSQETCSAFGGIVGDTPLVHTVVIKHQTMSTDAPWCVLRTLGAITSIVPRLGV